MGFWCLRMRCNGVLAWRSLGSLCCRVVSGRLRRIDCMLSLSATSYRRAGVRSCGRSSGGHDTHRVGNPRFRCSLGFRGETACGRGRPISGGCVVKMVPASAGTTWAVAAILSQILPISIPMLASSAPPVQSFSWLQHSLFGLQGNWRPTAKVADKCVLQRL